MGIHYLNRALMIIPMYKGNYRAKYINYRNPGIFLLTFMKAKKSPIFSRIVYTGNKLNQRSEIIPQLTTLGGFLLNRLNKFSSDNPSITIYRKVIMPDHIHLIISINEKLPQHLGKYLAKFKRESFLEAVDSEIIPPTIESIFDRGYNDQFLRSGRSLKILKDYVDENPYRYWLKHINPEFFKRIRNVSICDVNAHLYGNVELLKNPFICPVVYHHRYSESEWEGIKEGFRYTIYNGGVIAGAFVHNKEKEILKEAREAKGKIILISNRQIGEREKPGGSFFHLCGEGLLLIISPEIPEGLNRFEKTILGKEISRSECLFMNDLAERIARK